MNKPIIKFVNKNPTNPKQKIIEFVHPDLAASPFHWMFFFEHYPEHAVFYYRKFDQLHDSKPHVNLMEGLARYYATVYGKMTLCLPEELL